MMPTKHQFFCHFSFLYICCLLSFTSCVEFSYHTFDPNDASIIVKGSTRGDSDFRDNVLRLIDANPSGGTSPNSTGRAFYATPFQLWDPRSKKVTDFTTSFDFIISFGDQEYNSSISSGGFAMFISSEKSALSAPVNSSGGWLGLFNETTDGDPSNQVVAVEFDTYKDEWDNSNFHVGFDVNSVFSKNTRVWDELGTIQKPCRATLYYNGTSKTLSVSVESDSNVLNLSFHEDLSKVLPSKAFIGFSASTGQAAPVQLIITSWNFKSTMRQVQEDKGFEMWKVGLIISVLVVLVGLGMMLTYFWRNSRRNKSANAIDEEQGVNDSIDMDFENGTGTGPKRFPFKTLVTATKNFSEEGKLGQGGFGGVYKGYLAEQNIEIAVKKIADNSKQGRKEYVSEVTTISRLRHRNLVQLIGWSHQNESFLLVYEYMPNGSLDSHLYGNGNHLPLPWPTRFNIVKGLVSSLLYLHQECEQCVIHRDVKPSNIMLDKNFNAKLGDFGLAKILEHGLGSKTTILAGTMGYLAPEYVMTSKASKESDVYSFGVVALEVACGRRAVEHQQQDDTKTVLSKWIWELQANGSDLLQVVDGALNGDFNEDEMRRLLCVGLWCTHPDHKQRPSIKEAIQVLNFEVPMPILPSQMPTVRCLPSFSSYQFSYTNTSTSGTNSQTTIFSPTTPSTEEVSALIYGHR